MWTLYLTVTHQNLARGATNSHLPSVVTEAGLEEC